jgi:hypothetical protein
MDAHAEALKPPGRTFLPVEDVPEPKGPALTSAEQSKLKAELAAVRDRQAAAAKAQKGPADAAKPQ